jgi:hypothetical protein
MIFWTTPFDVDDPDDSPKSSHISGKEIKVILLALVVIVIAMIPVYRQMYESRNKHLCKINFSQMSKALGLYATENDGRFPPVAVLAAPGVPLLDKAGHPFTWGSLIAPSMNSRSSLRCASASEAEIAKSESLDSADKFVDMTYGMYGVYGGYPIDNIRNREQAIIIAETANRGAADTYDPKPILGLDGKPEQDDAYLIGFDTDNWAPSTQTKSVTRLAFPETKAGLFKPDGDGRHSKTIFVLTVGGAVKEITPDKARFKMLPNGESEGPWAVPVPEGR